MMEQYFALKYYEELIGCIISVAFIIGFIVLPFAWAAFGAIKKWWEED